MGYIPPVHTFISFYELDPSSRQNCIYVLKNGEICRWPRSEKEKDLAATIQKRIVATPLTELSLDLLQEYIKNNCCMNGNAKHKERIEDVNVLGPLAQRWLDEINSHAKQTVFLPTPATPARVHATTQDKFSIIPFPQQNRFPSSTNSPQSNSSMLWGTALSKYRQSERQSRYGLRSGDADDTISSVRRSSFISNRPISEFRPHIANPLPSDSVVGKIVEQLVKRDFETGSLYIFSRGSSPGYVKIGWTAGTIQTRLDIWAKCGYIPNLLFSVVAVRNARRVETLTHFELIKEWRRERRCKAPHCLKSHQEWFEVSIERATAVLGNWAEFMNKANPYGADGKLRPRWKAVVKIMEFREGFATSQKLLEHYEKTQQTAVAAAIAKASLYQVPKIKKEEEIPVLLERIQVAEQKTLVLQDNRSQKDIVHGVFSSKNEKLEKSERDPAKEFLAHPDRVNQVLPPEDIPLPISPILPPLIDSTVDTANTLDAISDIGETSQTPSERHVTDVARVLTPVT